MDSLALDKVSVKNILSEFIRSPNVNSKLKDGKFSEK